MKDQASPGRISHGYQTSLLMMVSVFFMAATTVHAQWIEQQKLLASGGAAFDQFGASVSISGDIAIVGSAYDDEVGFNAGAAYVFRYNTVMAQWVEEQKLTASDFQTSFQLQFGNSVSVSGNVVVVGNRRDDDKGQDSGAVYAFRYDAAVGEWIEEAKLTASNGTAGDHFGKSVSVSSDVILIGAFLSDVSGDQSGAAYVFRFDDGTGQWLEEQELTPSEVTGGDQFGGAVSVSGDVAVVTARGDDDHGSFSGAAYVFRYDAGTGQWAAEQKLTAGDATDGMGLGFSISVSDEVVFVGAINDNDAGLQAGSAYVFRYDSDVGRWIEEQKFLPDVPEEFGSFGISVSVFGEVGLVGHLSGGSLPFSGEVGVYRYDGDSELWLEQQTLTASDAATDDQFGIGVSISEDEILVGANVDDDNGEASGSAYVFGPADSDGDGVPDELDVCADTVIPEGVPTRRLGRNRFALVDSDGVFDTNRPRGGGPGLSFNIEETGGCSCEQIIDSLGLGLGHVKFGCSIGAMRAWVDLVSP